MTFCLGMTVEDGIVGIADSRVTSGAEIIQARKLSVFRQSGGSFFVMTSGLRSLRDKSLTYFDEALALQEEPCDRLFKVANLLATQMRLVSAEDKPSLVEGGFKFNMHAIIGGQMFRDASHVLYLVYPEGNWIEVGQGTPYQIIGSTAYGKPVLDRTLKYKDSLQFALKVGCLAFDSTRISAADVDFPIDVVIYSKAAHQITEHRYQMNDLKDILGWWQDRLRTSVSELPAEWIDRVFMNVLPAPEIAKT